MENAWLARIKRILAIAETGRNFTSDDFERERYDELSAIARGMLADLGSVPLNRIDGLVPEYTAKYATPSIDVRGAVIRGDRILLVREKLDGKWSLPGGFADIGYSAAENTEKEVFEEAGLQVRAERLYALRHKAKHAAYPPDVRDFYKLHFLCREEAEVDPEIGPETTDVGFFTADALPVLSLGRIMEQDITDAFAAHAASDGRVFMD
ncbi:MAG: NUDIX hydrolase N-terminal domain-containing protein [Paracoccaceae bacterium]